MCECVRAGIHVCMCVCVRACVSFCTCLRMCVNFEHIFSWRHFLQCTENQRCDISPAVNSATCSLPAGELIWWHTTRRKLYCAIRLTASCGGTSVISLMFVLPPNPTFPASQICPSGPQRTTADHTNDKGPLSTRKAMASHKVENEAGIMCVDYSSQSRDRKRGSLFRGRLCSLLWTVGLRLAESWLTAPFSFRPAKEIRGKVVIFVEIHAWNGNK